MSWAWLFIYPYSNGRINFGITDLRFGMKAQRLFPKGLQFISIPFDQLPSILQLNKKTAWITAPYEPDGLAKVPAHPQIKLKGGKN